uniref:Thioredoxin domain-containing protein n=1 Tax=Daucus carota subsp. sativus TaxID=79200 RepID=A0A165YBT2_DAUCS
MSNSTPIPLSFFIICAFSSLIGASALSPSRPATCPLQSKMFVYNLRAQSPLSFVPTPPLQVGGDFLEKALNSKDANMYTSVLFYASWCPFSNDVLQKFETLSSMFPQMTHLAVEESLVMPSILSRYGIHSFPTILIVKQTSKTRFHGTKDFNSLLGFYWKTTGILPVQYLAADQPVASLERNKEFIMQSWVGLSPTEILRKEPYLFKALWVSYGPHLNLEIFGETSQILGRILQIINVNRIWTKLKLCKTRNFLHGAKNARVWASSLASVSLGKTASCRSSS